MKITGSVREIITMFGHNEYLFSLVSPLMELVSDNAQSGSAWQCINQTMLDDAGYYVLNDEFNNPHVYFNVDYGDPQVQIEKLKQSAREWYIEANVIERDDYLNQVLELDLTPHRIHFVRNIEPAQTSLF